MALDNRRCILRSPTPVIEPGTISACTMRLPRIVARAVIVMRPAKSRPGASGGGIFEQCAAALFDVGRAGAVGVGACGTMLTGAGGGVCVAVIVGGGDGAWICTSGGGMNGGGGAANEGGGGTTKDIPARCRRGSACCFEKFIPALRVGGGIRGTVRSPAHRERTSCPLVT